MSQAARNGTDMAGRGDVTQRLQRLVSALMRVGVVLSLVMIVGGTVLTLTRQGDREVSRQAMQRLTVRTDGLAQRQDQTWASLFDSGGRGLTVLGLVVLMVTPVARVVVCHGAFLASRDRRFAAMTALALAGLLISFLLGKAG